MADLTTIGGSGLAALAILALREVVAWAREKTAQPAPSRETAIPPAPAQPSTHDGRLDAYGVRLERVERDVQQALDAANNIAGDVRELATLLKERTTRGGRKDGGHHESS